MSYELSFTPDFFSNEQEKPNYNRPTNVIDAIEAMRINHPELFSAMKEEVFNITKDNIYLDAETVLKKIYQTNTCSNLDSPVEVWIDEEGFYTVLVY